MGDHDLVLVTTIVLLALEPIVVHLRLRAGSTMTAVLYQVADLVGEPLASDLDLFFLFNCWHERYLHTHVYTLTEVFSK